MSWLQAERWRLLRNWICKNGTKLKLKFIDGDFDTRWESKAEDPQAFTIELPQEEKIGGMKIYWEGAAAKKYVVETSTDNKNWNVAFTQNKGLGGQGYGDAKIWTNVKEMRNQKYGEHTVNYDAVSARYVKFQGVKSAMNYGYSMWEFKVIAK